MLDDGVCGVWGPRGAGLLELNPTRRKKEVEVGHFVATNPLMDPIRIVHYTWPCHAMPKLFHFHPRDPPWPVDAFVMNCPLPSSYPERPTTFTSSHQQSNLGRSKNVVHRCCWEKEKVYQALAICARDAARSLSSTLTRISVVLRMSPSSYGIVAAPALLSPMISSWLELSLAFAVGPPRSGRYATAPP